MKLFQNNETLLKIVQTRKPSHKNNLSLHLSITLALNIARVQYMALKLTLGLCINRDGAFLFCRLL